MHLNQWPAPYQRVIAVVTGVIVGSMSYSLGALIVKWTIDPQFVADGRVRREIARHPFAYLTALLLGILLMEILARNAKAELLALVMGGMAISLFVLAGSAILPVLAGGDFVLPSEAQFTIVWISGAAAGVATSYMLEQLTSAK